MEAIAVMRIKAMDQVPKNGYESEPRTSTAIVFRIIQSDFPGAAIVALCKEDTVALNVLCYYLIEGRNLGTSETSDA